MKIAIVIILIVVAIMIIRWTAAWFLRIDEVIDELKKANRNLEDLKE
jgi:Tfp pilus assembly protein PilO